MSDTMNQTLEITYEVVSEVYRGGRISYGIAVCQGGIPIEVIPDISKDLNAIAELVKSCNELRLSHEHIRDVVEDFLNQ